MTGKERKWYRKILWFDNRRRYDIDFFDLLQPRRTVSEHRRYKSGVYFSEKSRRWIQYESGMERDFILQMEQMSNVLFYFEQPVQIPYWRGRRKQTYTPDFGLYLDTGEFVLVEVKDLTSMLDDRVQMKVEALMRFCSQKGFGLLLTDGKDTFDKLLKTRMNRRLERAVLKAVEGSIVRKEQCGEIMERCRATRAELLKVIAKHSLRFKPFPFKLGQGNRNELFRRVFVEKKKYDEVVKDDFREKYNKGDYPPVGEDGSSSSSGSG